MLAATAVKSLQLCLTLCDPRDGSPPGSAIPGILQARTLPDELWNEVLDIVQETGIKTIPMEKKCKKGNWLSGEALQIAVKRKVKSKGEKERYKHLNAEFKEQQEEIRKPSSAINAKK